MNKRKPATLAADAGDEVGAERINDRLIAPSRQESRITFPETESPPKADPFADLDRLRLSQDFAADSGVKKLLTTVPVRKPHRQEWIRVHPDEGYRLQTAVLELKDDRETYLLLPELWPELPGELKPVALFTVVNRQGVVYLWPVKLPGEDGRIDEWNRSALEAADHAAHCWVRVAANMSLGAYEIFEATGNLPDPQWPELDFTTLLRTAFKVKFIDSMEHPVVKRLRGEA